MVLSLQARELYTREAAINQGKDYKCIKLIKHANKRGYGIAQRPFQENMNPNSACSSSLQNVIYCWQRRVFSSCKQILWAGNKPFQRILHQVPCSWKGHLLALPFCIKALSHSAQSVQALSMEWLWRKSIPTYFRKNPESTFFKNEKKERSCLVLMLIVEFQYLKCTQFSHC